MEAIDLGLSVKWADCNLGATKPEEYGNYYAWGEIEPKTTYSFNTYKWTDMQDERRKYIIDLFNKYCTHSDYGEVDNKTVLDLADDAAAQILGSKWCIPTDEEWRELREKCTQFWTTRNGISGYEIKSKINGKSIFIPASGYRESNALYGSNYCGRYWVSELDEEYSLLARSVNVSPAGIHRYSYCRYNGQSIRPVLIND